MNEKKELPKKIKTTIKRARQNTKRRIRNRSFKSQFKTSHKLFLRSVDVKDSKTSTELANTLFSLLDKGLKRKMLKQNKVSRLKASISKLLNA
jgi:small subunit ribosomal protein S20